MPILSYANTPDVIDERSKPLPILPTNPTAPATPQTHHNKQTVSIDEAVLQDNPVLTQTILQSALKNKQWELVGELTTIYHTQPHDERLYHVASAGFWRWKSNYDKSLWHYQQALELLPDVVVLRVDYMTALMEDRRYADVRQQLDKLQTMDSRAYGQLLARYRQLIDDRQRWQRQLSVHFEQTDNVNQASDERYLWIGDKRFEKDEDSLPQKATGLSYRLSTQKQHNLYANHFWTMSGELSGVVYWDNGDFNETTATVKSGYQFQNRKGGIKIEPLADYTWFDDKAYRRQIGLSSGAWYAFSPKWQLSSGMSIAKQWHFDQKTADTYDGIQKNAHASVFWTARPNLTVYTGVDVGNKNAKNARESFSKKGVRVGMQANNQTLPSWRVNARVGERQHKMAHAFFGQIRQDDEFQLSGAMWYPKWQYKGYTPTLNYQYTKIDSNLNGLYGRTNQSWFVSIEKAF